jgi:hypothetical protein
MAIENFPKLGNFILKIYHLATLLLRFPFQSDSLFKRVAKSWVTPPDGATPPGVDVMITIFGDFRQLSAKKLAFFSKTNVMIKILHNHSTSERT